MQKGALFWGLDLGSMSLTYHFYVPQLFHMIVRKIRKMSPNVQLTRQDPPNWPHSDFALSKSYDGKEASLAFELQLPPFAIATKQLLRGHFQQLRKKEFVFSEFGLIILKTEVLFWELWIILNIIQNSSINVFYWGFGVYKWLLTVSNFFLFLPFLGVFSIFTKMLRNFSSLFGAGDYYFNFCQKVL